MSLRFTWFALELFMDYHSVQYSDVQGMSSSHAWFNGDFEFVTASFLHLLRALGLGTC